MDRRKISDRIALLRKRLARIQRRRSLQRSGRLGFPVGAVVGYTNVGKSTLINRLAGSNLVTGDKLFATLDAMTRRVELRPGRFILLTDTVGFIRKFPPELAASFRSTLEEAIEADFLVHIADASHPRIAEQVETVERILEELGARAGTIVRVLNKVDAVRRVLELRKRLPAGDWIPVSARTGRGLAHLRQVLARFARVSETATAN
ncbi:MAG: hypothetical protein D6679_02835 [Candidatus Hydrogenedentota bacterium]|nr:MAG: hypothetical protein D6679_02835 [Candidatus Hydrogenedentota bacterium]